MYTSEISQEAKEKILAARSSNEEYSKAFQFLRRELGGLPEHAMAIYLSKIYAACRTDAEVCQEIGDKIDHPLWVVAEVYIHLGRA